MTRQYGLPSFTLNQLIPELAQDILDAPLIDVGEWHAMDVSGRTELVSKEVQDLVLDLEVPMSVPLWQSTTSPNLPWAEDHFLERISGKPLNPPPSSEYWPFAVGSNASNDRHKIDGQFSHTYPERFWPKHAGGAKPGCAWTENHGIRFNYGDYADLVDIMVRNPFTRQAYLPIWFPEDLGAARQNQRVPCTLGYHFMARPTWRDIHIWGQEERIGVAAELPVTMNCNYYLRSCDFMRYFVDDVYMAGRLLQHTCLMVGDRVGYKIFPGILSIHISSLHAFVGDEPRLKEMANRGR